MRRTYGAIAVAALVAVSTFVATAPAGAATAGTISRFAGNGTQGFSGNGGAATAAEFYSVSDEAFSASGVGYIADMKNCQVRQVVNGVISAFAGVGTCATRGNGGLNPLSGLGGPAAAATIGMPTGVAVDSSGNVYIADCTDYTGVGPGCSQGYILKVSGGTITALVTPAQIGSLWTAIGNGGTGAAWGVRAAGGNVYFSDVVDNVVDEVSSSGGTPVAVAGNGRVGYSGNGGLATAAELDDPTGLYVDGSGNVFIADSKNAVIRKVNTNGVISTFAGTGTAGSTGNGGLATTAELNKPFGVVEDSSGNVYIADYNAFCVREVYANGDIGTYSGTCGTAGVTNEGGAPSSVLLEGPSQVVFDSSGNLYINDYAAEQIDEVAGVESTLLTPSTPTISNLPSSGTVGSGFTASVTTNSNGTTSVTSNSASVCTASGLVVSFVGTGTCSLTAQVAASSTYAAATGTAQTVQVAPASLLTPSTPTISNLPTSGTVGSSFTASVSTNSNGTTSVTSNSASVCTASGLVVSFVGTGTCSLTAQVAASSTYAAATGTAQTVQVAAATPSSPTISNLPSSGTVGSGFTASVTTNSNGTTSVTSNSASVCTASGLAVSFVGTGTCSLRAQVAASSTYAAATGTAQTVAVTGASGTISRFAGNGTQGFSGNGGAATAAEFYSVSDEAFSASGVGYIADMKNCQVRQVVNGVISAFAGVGTCATRGNGGTNSLKGMGGQAAAATIGMPTGVAVGPSGNVYIADCVVYTGTGPGCTEGYILEVSTGGIISIFAGDSKVGDGGSGGKATATSIGAPWGVRTDTAGDVYFSDVVYNVVREVNTNGIITTVAGNGREGYSGNGGLATAAELNDPTGLYVDGLGNLFIADSKNAVIRKVNTSGVISTFAGNGTAGSTGNGGLATAAELNKPFGVVEDSSGNVYIADYSAACVREVNTTGDISTYSGTCGTAGVTKEGGAPSSVLLEGPSQVVFDASGNLYINDYGAEQIDEVAGAE